MKDDRHEGLDLYARTGDNILAGRSGKVSWASDKRRSDGKPSAYGWHVILEHEGEYYESWYCHLANLSVKVGDMVNQGAVLGPAGSTGNSTGVHLHFNVRKLGHIAGVGYVLPDVVDPLPLLEGEPEPPDPPTPPVGNARLGLHASADPGDLTTAEIQEFKAAKVSVIKVLSAHSGPSIAALANQHPAIPFIIRAFLDFGGRVITPTQFFSDTINDTKRAVDAIGSGREILIELHNEPNLTSEGLGASWADGAAFNVWLLAVLWLYRAALPAAKYLYPGLSPQFTGYRPFLLASQQAAMACDGVGVHCYWSNDYSMNQALTDTVDWYRGVFGSKPLWVTEASHNKTGVSASQKGLQYITFLNELKKRPSVAGVTYFVASASNPAFGWGTGGSCETWLGQGIGAIVGER